MSSVRALLISLFRAEGKIYCECFPASAEPSIDFRPSLFRALVLHSFGVPFYSLRLCRSFISSHTYYTRQDHFKTFYKSLETCCLHLFSSYWHRPVSLKAGPSVKEISTISLDEQTPMTIQRLLLWPPMLSKRGHFSMAALRLVLLKWDRPNL